MTSTACACPTYLAQVKLTHDDIEGAINDLRRAVRGRTVAVAHACLATALFKLDEVCVCVCVCVGKCVCVWVSVCG
jgi:hypothetical protein